MTQKEEKFQTKYGIMSLRQPLTERKETSHEHFNTKSKEKASSS